MTPLALHNQHVQRLRRLIGRRESRLAESVVVVEGAKLLDEALDAGVLVDAVFVTDGVSSPVVDRARALGAACHVVAAGVLDRVGDAVSPPPVCSIVGWKPAPLESLRSGLADGGFVVIGVDVRDPGNAGTLVRCAEASGAAGVVLAGQCVDMTSPKVVRSTAGALFHVPVAVSPDVLAVLAMLGEWGVRTWATAVRPGVSVSLDDADLTGPTAVLLGNEAHGLSDATIAAATGLVHIPMAGRTESLNVSMAAAVVAYEAARQRRAL